MVGEEGCCPSVVAICYLEDAAACHPASRLAGVHSSPGFHDKSRLLGSWKHEQGRNKGGENVDRVEGHSWWGLKAQHLIDQILQMFHGYLKS